MGLVGGGGRAVGLEWVNESKNVNFGLYMGTFQNAELAPRPSQCPLGPAGPGAPGWRLGSQNVERKWL